MQTYENRYKSKNIHGQVLLAEDEEDLQYMTRKIKEQYEKWGLLIYINKTKRLCIGREEPNLKLEEEIKIRNNYKYLGVL